MKEKDIRCLRQMVILVFVLSVTVPMLPCHCVNAYGLFGEVKAVTAAKEADSGITLIASQNSVWKQQKGINIRNIWFALWIRIICICFLMCVCKLPREDTPVDKKVRMNP